MKHVWLFLWLLITGFSAVAVPADTYVWARAGLNLRKEPAKTASVLRKLPFGSRLTVLSRTELRDSVKELPGFYVHGYWTKAAAGKDTGYLFDGYLLPYRPVSFLPEKEYPAYRGGKIEKFLATHFASATGKKILNYYPPDYCGHPVPSQHPDECVQKYRIDFRGIVFTFEHVPEKNDRLDILFPHMTLQQVYLLALYAVSEENGPGQVVSYGRGRISIAPDGAGCSIELSPDAEGRIVWAQHCGC